MIFEEGRWEGRRRGLEVGLVGVGCRGEEIVKGMDVDGNIWYVRIVLLLVWY